MGGGPKSRKAPAARRKRVLSKSMIDDEAEESNDGVLVDPSVDVDDQNPYGSDQELDRYEEEFINDGYTLRVADTSADPFDARSEDDSDSSSLPAALMPEPITPPTNKRTRGQAVDADPVIDISSSSEEDLTAMDVDDRKPAGVKASTLPPSLVTRSATAKRTATSQSSQPLGSPKKPRTSRNVVHGEDKASLPEPLAASTGAFGSQADMMQFMTTFMNSYLAAQAAPTAHPVSDAARDARESRDKSIPRVDFDAIELQKGLQASKMEARSVEKQKHSTRGAGSSRRRDPSPAWDPPYDEVDEDPSPASKGKGRSTLKPSVELRGEAEPTTKGKGKAKAKALPSNKSSKSRAADLISRVESGEDMQDTPAPETQAVVPPVTAAAPTTVPLTLQQYFALHGSVTATASAIASAPDQPVVDDADHPTVFMEQLETYKAYYDAFAPCGVNDEDLQDPVLTNSYIGQPPLPGDRSILPVYDPSRLSGQEQEPIKGGRVKFSTWARYIPAILADNAIGAVLFREADPNFINPSRVSPLRLTSQISAGSAATQRLMVDGRVAMCVTSLFCTESFLVEPRKIGANSDRTRKWISGIPHNQDYERLEALLCLVLGESVLYAQITPKKAMSFQTMMSPANAAAIQETDQAFTSAPSDMFAPVTPSKSPAKSKSPSKTWNFTSKTLLASHDRGKRTHGSLCRSNLPCVVPVYDARTVVFDFNADLGRLASVLPVFHGEVPFGSFVVVGYTIAGYKASLSAGGERVPHLGCNILWAIVCGTPPLQGKNKK
ncbi:hypothetical protein C8R47DRAFT_1064388 [Mycena vitilis]|nr:hypothetical protein C8R47DRAFT_1064388 [Mycena vitilis]